MSMYRNPRSTRESVPRVFAALLLLAGCLAARSAADDAVYLYSPKNPRARVKIVGRIVDYTGRELVLETGAGEKRYAADQVVDVESQWSPAQQAGDERFAVHDYAAALAKYEEALRGEKRRWVKRRLAAQMIWCLRNLDQYRRAGGLFLALSRDDATLLHFSCIPLQWLPHEASADLEKKSREWLASGDPLAILMGASHLLSTADRSQVVKRLEPLTSNDDARIASLARALVWSATYASASTNQLATWSDELEQFPEAVRAGPYFVLGRAWAQHHEPERAALNLLRVPLVHADDRLLAAAALFAAGQALEQAGEPTDAARAYGELVADYPQSRLAAQAQERLKELEHKRAATEAGA
jgi:tetratricopeptide (TPR) repeat protein